MPIDTSKWSGEGTFTQTLIDQLAQLDAIESVRVEDAPASRSEADYNFISNEIFVVFATRAHDEPFRRFGFLPATRRVLTRMMTVAQLEVVLASIPAIGAPDYSDE